MKGAESDLKNQNRATIWVGPRAFDLIVTPLKSGATTTRFVPIWAIAIERLQNLEYKGQLQPIGWAQAVIEFTPPGEMVLANENVPNATGYTLAEIRVSPIGFSWRMGQRVTRSSQRCGQNVDFHRCLTGRKIFPVRIGRDGLDRFMATHVQNSSQRSVAALTTQSVRKPSASRDCGQNSLHSSLTARFP